MGLHDGSLLPALERGEETKGSKGGVVERNIMERKQKEGREGIYRKEMERNLWGKGGRKRNRKVWDDPHVKLYLNTHCQEVTCPSTITLQHPF